MTTNPRYGILGVGALGSAIVTGLCADVDDAPEVMLSPRGADRAAQLAGRFSSVRVAEDNQAVLDAAEVVVVCLRQRDAGLLGELSWRPDQVVISAVAGISLEMLASFVRPAVEVACAVPMPEVATRSSATPVHPALAVAGELFDRLGGTVPIATSAQFDAVFTALGTVAPHLEYLAVIEEFLADHGVPAETARRLVGDTFAGLAATLSDLGGRDFAELATAYAPPGGGNDQLATILRDAGVPARTRQALDEVHRRLSGGRV